MMLNEFQSFESGAAFLAPKNSGPISPHGGIHRNMPTENSATWLWGIQGLCQKTSKNYGG